MTVILWQLCNRRGGKSVRAAAAAATVSFNAPIAAFQCLVAASVVAITTLILFAALDTTVGKELSDFGAPPAPPARRSIDFLMLLPAPNVVDAPRASIFDARHAPDADQPLDRHQLQGGNLLRVQGQDARATLIRCVVVNPNWLRLCQRCCKIMISDQMIEDHFFYLDLLLILDHILEPDLMFS